MEKWKKIFKLALLGIALFACAPTGIQAQSYDACCEPYYDPCCDTSGFYVGGEFLWLKPCVDELNYAALRNSASDKNYKFKSVCTDWEPGFRIYLGKSDCVCDWNFSGSYMYTNSCSSSSTERENNVLPTNSHPAFFNPGPNNFFDRAKGNYEACYHEWDVLVSFDNSCNDCNQITHSFGVAGIVFDQELKSKLEEQVTPRVLSTRWSSDYWGVGFRIGTDYKKELCDGFNFFATGRASILVGEADCKTEFDSRDADELADHTFRDDEKICHVVPGYRIAAGFTYDSCYCNTNFSFRLGYEFLVWHNLPNKKTFVADADPDRFNGPEVALSTASSIRTFGLHGLIAGFEMSF